MEILRLTATTIRLPGDLLKELDTLANALGTERSEIIRQAIMQGLRELKIELAAKRYSQGEISFGRAVEIAGTPYWSFVEELKRRGITLRYGEERFLEELKELIE